MPSRPAAIVNGILTSGLARACYYAASRPDCQVLASVRYGPVALCALCDQQRSTLGKGTLPAALPDPRALPGIAAAGDACQQAAAALRHAVAAARQAGHPRSAVAAILGGTRQAARQRFAHSPDTTPAPARKGAGR
ncbi:MAG TPA: hypothetical protein VMV92_44720 [Streptosporangiaceae bacterium]|nr:hypothetical protein [Streptosporangiaceae bacterium]